MLSTEKRNGTVTSSGCFWCILNDWYILCNVSVDGHCNDPMWQHVNDLSDSLNVIPDDLRLITSLTLLVRTTFSPNSRFSQSKVPWLSGLIVSTCLLSNVTVLTWYYTLFTTFKNWLLDHTGKNNRCVNTYIILQLSCTHQELEFEPPSLIQETVKITHIKQIDCNMVLSKADYCVQWYNMTPHGSFRMFWGF